MKEAAAQDKISKLGIKLLKGILVISLVTFDNGTTKIVISKADHDEFLDSTSYQRRSGLPLKKKIYKAFIGEFDENTELKTTSVYDTNSSFTVYWWRDFLELCEVYTKEYNTEKAFDIIEAKILTPLKKNSKPDYLNLWNATVHYFRCKNEFSLEEYNETVIKNYRPFNESLVIKDLESKVLTLPEKFKFDGKFEIVHSLINKKFKKSIKLTPQIELHLKEDITDFTNTIKTQKEQDGSKWVMIKSTEGFEYFENTISEPK